VFLASGCCNAIVCVWEYCIQAFINTAKEIYQKIQDGVFDVNNEVSSHIAAFIVCPCSDLSVLVIDFS